MDKNEDLIEQLQQLLSHKKSKVYYAGRLGITVEEVDELLKELKNKDKVVEFENKEWTWDKKVNQDKGTLESSIELDFEPKSDEDLYKLHKIDKTKYKISSYWSKLKSNGKFTSSVFATLKKPKDYTAEDFSKFLKDWKFTDISDKQGKLLWFDHDNEWVNIELNIADFHLAKKTFQKDTL
jgi:hypothetical protein